MPQAQFEVKQFRDAFLPMEIEHEKVIVSKRSRDFEQPILLSDCHSLMRPIEVCALCRECRVASWSRLEYDHQKRLHELSHCKFRLLEFLHRGRCNIVAVV